MAKAKFLTEKELRKCASPEKTVREIAEEVGRSVTGVRQALKKYGLPYMPVFGMSPESNREIQIMDNIALVKSKMKTMRRDRVKWANETIRNLEAQL